MLVSHIMSNDESLLTTQRQECNVRNENNNRYNVVKTKKGKGPGYEIDTEMKIEQTMKKTVLIKLLIWLKD